MTNGARILQAYRVRRNTTNPLWSAGLSYARVMPPSRVTIYHNSRCSKSRETLDLLRERGIEPAVVEYLKEPPDARALKALLKKLGMKASELIRKKEKEFGELGLAKKLQHEEALISAMASHPILIERPIVVCGERARLGRPPEAVLELLE